MFYKFRFRYKKFGYTSLAFITIVLCKTQMHFTILSASSTSFSIAFEIIHHLEYNIPKAHSTVFITLDKRSLKLRRLSINELRSYGSSRMERVGLIKHYVRSCHIAVKDKVRFWKTYEGGLKSSRPNNKKTNL